MRARLTFSRCCGRAGGPCYAGFASATLAGMWETLLSVALLVGILGASAVLTELFVRKMYYRCKNCATLNAKRRSQCRKCGQALP